MTVAVRHGVLVNHSHATFRKRAIWRNHGQARVYRVRASGPTSLGLLSPTLRFAPLAGGRRQKLHGETAGISVARVRRRSLFCARKPTSAQGQNAERDHVDQLSIITLRLRR